MFKRVLAFVVAAYLCVTVAHLFLNGGFEKLALFRGTRPVQAASVRVGFLPVT